MRLHFLRDSDRCDDPDARTVAIVPGDDPVELYPAASDSAPADRLVKGGQAHTATELVAQAKWCAAFLLTGCAIGAVAVAVVNHYT